MMRLFLELCTLQRELALTQLECALQGGAVPVTNVCRCERNGDARGRHTRGHGGLCVFTRVITARASIFDASTDRAPRPSSFGCGCAHASPPSRLAMPQSKVTLRHCVPSAHQSSKKIFQQLTRTARLRLTWQQRMAMQIFCRPFTSWVQQRASRQRTSRDAHLLIGLLSSDT